MIVKLISILNLVLLVSNEHCSLFDSFSRIYYEHFNDLNGDYYLKTIDLRNFKNFSEIDFNCLDQKKSKVNTINLIPMKPLSLDKNLNTSVLSSLVETIRFQNLNSFDLNTYFFRNFFVYIRAEFFYSKFKILQNEQDLCDQNLNNYDSYSKFSAIKFALVTYSKNTCPLIFDFLIISELIFYGISDIFIKKNILGFRNLENTTQNYQISSLSLHIFKSKLTRDLIDHNLFNNTESFEINGLIVQIESDVFDKMKPKVIHFQTDDLLSLFQDGGFWLNSFQIITNPLKLENFYEIILDGYKFFNLKDENLCFFKHVPLNRAYLISISFNYNTYECTCTLSILFSTYFNLGNYSNNFRTYFTYLTYENLKMKNCMNYTFLNECLEKVKKCDIKTRNKIYSDYNLLDFSLNVEFYSIIISQIIISCGFLSNLINIIVLYTGYRDKNLKKETSKGLYKLMILNSLTNIIYFFIYSFHIINRCVEINGIYCSVIYKNKISQFFMIYFVEYLGSILKFWSSLTMIAISVARLSFLSSKNCLKEKKNFRSWLLLALFYSIVINLDKVFVIFVNDNEYVLDFDFSNEFPDRNSFINKLTIIRGGRNLKYHGEKSIIFYVLYVFNFCTNDIVLYAILTCLDLSICNSLRGNIKLKKLILTKISEFENLNFKVNVVIIFNMTILFGFRTTHLFINSYLFYLKLKPNLNNQNLCYKYGRMCSYFQEASEIFNLLANCYNIFLFYHLNKVFRILFLNLLNKFNFRNQSAIPLKT
ncbi:unnamed protein product [Brachionus calyciflorus]|uniref:G-protein coupled receptors family 1 profile domain-containing protein n=1 Tax=Brachionus calyciflorus TaxID=104777 RepID=A0A814K2T9_9BILA|nr:unnamed protein product [Brachionus calyciflorus]